MIADEPIPEQWPWLFNGFRRYCVKYARRNFHGVRLSKSSAPLPLDGAPILIAANHPSWWDPITFFILSRDFTSCQHYGAIDAQAVEKYRFMKRAGLFPVEMNSVRGAAQFLRTGQAILKRDHVVLWITGQGQFVDVRQRPLGFRSGVGHLAARMTRGWVLPLAVEYPFWNESKPEVLARFGPPIAVKDHGNRDGKAWTTQIEAEVTQTLDALNAEAMTRNAGQFTSMIRGRVGVGGVYDLWRRSTAWITGRRFDASHEAPS